MPNGTPAHRTYLLPGGVHVAVVAPLVRLGVVRYAVPPHHAAVVLASAQQNLQLWPAVYYIFTGGPALGQ